MYFVTVRFCSVMFKSLDLGTYDLVLVLECPGLGLGTFDLVLECPGLGLRTYDLVLECPGLGLGLGIETRVLENPGPGETRSFCKTRNPGL